MPSPQKLQEKNESRSRENPKNSQIVPPPSSHPFNLIKFLGAPRPEGERVEFHGTPNAPRYLDQNEVGTSNDAPRSLDRNQVGTSNDAPYYLDPIQVGTSNDVYVVHDSSDDDYVEFD